MDHLQRFHRRRRDVAPPTLITNDLSGKTTPPPGELNPASPMRPFQKLSPFRVFHRSSGKRARDSPPASLPHSPTAAPVLAGNGAEGRPVSPLSLKTVPPGGEGQKAAKPPKMPAFLEQSEQEIENKFSELVWRERNRIMQSITNPAPDFRWARVTGSHLKLLDRYMNIQPWHNNRIKLQVPEGHVDYVNASPIVLPPPTHPTADGRASDTREPDRYIAMQGPKQSSTDHVWRMVVEQLDNPGVIVMLTETHEGPMEKCYPYFPRTKDDPPLEINERDEFGDGFRATVRCEGMEETPAGDAIELRKLVIRVYHNNPKPAPTSRASTPAQPASPAADNEKDADSDIKMKSPIPNKSTSSFPPTDNEPSSPSTITSTTTTTTTLTTPTYEDRTVWHFLYKKWPDFGVPALTDLDSFFTLMRLSREKNTNPASPRIVHCSAGVGRSGTFVALEYLMRELESGGLVGWDEEEGHHLVIPGGEDGEGEEGDGEGFGFCFGSGQGEDLVFETVDRLREQRRTMVQAESQYLFIYRVLRKLWVDRYGRYEEEGWKGEGGRAGREDDDDGAIREPAAKRLEVDPFVDHR